MLGNLIPKIYTSYPQHTPSLLSCNSSHYTLSCGHADHESQYIGVNRLRYLSTLKVYTPDFTAK